jgi:hypothetical protein
VLGGGKVPNLLRSASEGHVARIAVEDWLCVGGFFEAMSSGANVTIIHTLERKLNVADLTMEVLHLPYFILMKLAS